MALIKRGNKYSVRYVISTQFREVLGKSQVWKTTGTGCLSVAKRREPRILADIIDTVESDYNDSVSAADGTPISPESLFEAALDLAGEVRRGEPSNEDATSILSDYRDQFLKANEKLNSKAYFKAARSAHAAPESEGRDVPLQIAINTPTEFPRMR